MNFVLGKHYTEINISIILKSKDLVLFKKQTNCIVIFVFILRHVTKIFDFHSRIKLFIYSRAHTHTGLVVHTSTNRSRKVPDGSVPCIGNAGECGMAI